MSPLQFSKEIWRGKDTYRILMNRKCSGFTLFGQILDVGSGVNLASYHRFFKKEKNINIIPLDMAVDQVDRKSSRQLDLESDPLPTGDKSVDFVLVFNLFEHLYNHTLLMCEIKRVLKSGGSMIGAVPFLVGYHADPHDFWRYTSETLERRFKEVGFSEIKIDIIGRGPFSAALSQIEFILPRIIKLIITPKVIFLDYLLNKLRPNLKKEKFALGLFFSAKA